MANDRPVIKTVTTWKRSGRADNYQYTHEVLLGSTLSHGMLLSASQTAWELTVHSFSGISQDFFFFYRDSLPQSVLSR